MKKQIVEMLSDEVWRITRPCCGTSGMLMRPENRVRILHKRGCRREHENGSA